MPTLSGWNLKTNEKQCKQMDNATCSFVGATAKATLLMRHLRLASMSFFSLREDKLPRLGISNRNPTLLCSLDFSLHRRPDWNRNFEVPVTSFLSWSGACLCTFWIEQQNGRSIWSRANVGKWCQGDPLQGRKKPLTVWRLVALCQGLCRSACHVPSGLDIAGPFLVSPPLKTYGSCPFGSAYATALHPHRLVALLETQEITALFTSSS